MEFGLIPKQKLNRKQKHVPFDLTRWWSMLTTLKLARKPVKLQKESPAGCAGEGKQSKGN